MTIKIYDVESTPANIFHCLSPTLCSAIISHEVFPVNENKRESKFILDTELSHILTNMAKERILYQCGSPNLVYRFDDLGYEFLGYFIHKNGKKICLYQMCPEMAEFLSQWTKNKPKKEVGE